MTGRTGPFTIDVDLRFQSVAFRWAENLKKYEATETRRFVGYYEAMSPASSEVLSHPSVTTNLAAASGLVVARGGCRAPGVVRASRP